MSLNFARVQNGAFPKMCRLLRRRLWARHAFLHPWGKRGFSALGQKYSLISTHLISSHWSHLISRDGWTCCLFTPDRYNHEMKSLQSRGIGLACAADDGHDRHWDRLFMSSNLAEEQNNKQSDRLYIINFSIFGMQKLLAFIETYNMILYFEFSGTEIFSLMINSWRCNCSVFFNKLSRFLYIYRPLTGTKQTFID